MSTLNDLVEQLQQINLSLRQQLEQAELLIPELNRQIDQLATIGLIGGITLEGDLIVEYWDPEFGDQSTLQQAVLCVPGGLGLACWNREEYLARGSNPQELARPSRSRFLPFIELTSAEKALLLPQVEPLLTSLLQTARLL